MSLPVVRSVFPVVASVLAALVLATAVPHGLVPEAAAAELAMAPELLARAEVQRCVDGGREADACLDEADGKALIEHAEWQTRVEGARRAGR